MGKKKYIDAKEFWNRLISVSENDWVGFDTIDEVLSGMPAEPRWMPVTKRLSKKDGRYLVTRYDDVTNTEFIDILWYEENLWWNRHSTGDYAVTAWMPLPTPYKGGEDE